MKSSSPEKNKPEEVRRKQIETTLNQLHRLQSQIYQLNVPENPHSSAPVKKEVKQLTYLYQNMIKPKTKNNLDIKKEDISKAISFIEGSNSENQSVDSRKINKIMKEMFGSELEVGLIKKGDGRPGKLSVDELYQFINFNEFDNFDPLKQTYNMFIDEKGKFNFKKYQEMNEILGLPPVANQRIFQQTLGLNHYDTLSFSKFCEIMKYKP